MKEWHFKIIHSWECTKETMMCGQKDSLTWGKLFNVPECMCANQSKVTCDSDI